MLNIPINYKAISPYESIFYCSKIIISEMIAIILTNASKIHTFSTNFCPKSENLLKCIVQSNNSNNCCSMLNALKFSTIERKGEWVRKCVVVDILYINIIEAINRFIISWLISMFQLDQRSCSVVVIMLAYHAQGLRFKAGRKLFWENPCKCY